MSSDLEFEWEWVDEIATSRRPLGCGDRSCGARDCPTCYPADWDVVVDNDAVEDADSTSCPKCEVGGLCDDCLGPDLVEWVWDDDALAGRGGKR